MNTPLVTIKFINQREEPDQVSIPREVFNELVDRYNRYKPIIDLDLGPEVVFDFT